MRASWNFTRYENGSAETEFAHFLLRFLDGCSRSIFLIDDIFLGLSVRGRLDAHCVGEIIHF